MNIQYHLIVYLMCSLVSVIPSLQARPPIAREDVSQERRQDPRVVRPGTRETANSSQTVVIREPSRPNNVVVQQPAVQRPGSATVNETVVQTPQKKRKHSKKSWFGRLLGPSTPKSTQVHVEVTTEAPTRTVINQPIAPAPAYGAYGAYGMQEQTVQSVPVGPVPVNPTVSSGVVVTGNRPGAFGARVVGQRPVVMQRALPETVFIDRRSVVCPYITRTPFEISRKGDLIELDDGSIWKVRHRDRKSVQRWRSNDAILIETGKFFSWYTYTLVNYTRGESIDVELSFLQNWSGRSAHWIVEVNPMLGYLRLEDNSIWRMSASELYEWSVNDDVIIALTKDWFSNRYSYVLVNPRAKNRFIATFEFGL